MSLAKSAPTGMGLAGFPGGTVTLEFTLTAVCPSCTGTPCPTPATPTAASVSVDFYPGGAGACPPGPPAGVPTFSFAGPVALPACSAGGEFTTYTVVVPVPDTTPLGAYCAYGTVSVTFSDGLTLAASGDTMVCIVSPAPGQPGVPRLSVTLLSESAPRLAPGDVAMARYVVRNNDPSNSVQLTAFGTSRQSALRPQGANERQGVFTISSPFGDDFPILFNPSSNCIPLPDHPYTQQVLSNTLPIIPPGGSNVIIVGIRSYGQCANGSCSESTLRVSGTFTDGSPAMGCAGMALVVDTSRPSTTCAAQVNDCNHNGIPDALDIAQGTSQDRNFNAMPDECEQFISVPTSTSVTPTNPPPGTPIVVRVAFNEVVPMSNVWANGSSLTRMTIGGIPFWQGTIPADTRPGPQTVYFLGKDQAGGMSTFIAPYNVPAPNRPPTISDIPDQVIQQSTSTGPIPFVIGDAETSVASLTVTATSSNTSLIPNANIIIAGTGSNRTVQATPAGSQTGIALIVVTVSDGNGGTASDTFVVTVQPAGVKEVFSPTGNPTPPNFVYATLPGAAPVTFPNGFVLRNIIHGRLRFHMPPPPLNSNQVYTSGSDVRFEVSMNGGATFSNVVATGDVSVRLNTFTDDGSSRTFNTEMLSLNITGGTLPPGVRIRESPTLVSPGRATSRLVASGGAMVSSYFDVNIELSVNNGATWMGGSPAPRVVLGPDAPEVFSLSANPTPPSAIYASAPGVTTTNQNGVRIRNVSHGRLRLHPAPPLLGTNQIYTSDGEVRLEFSPPGSTAFNNVVSPSSVSVRLGQVKDDGVSKFFDTEMLSLDVMGGGLPPGVIIRESPTRQSLGRATLRELRGGGAMVSSFFDVQIDVSVNNGATFTPSLTPVRIELAMEAPENLSRSGNTTPPSFSYNTPVNPPLVTNQSGIILRRVRHGRLALHPQPPPVVNLSYTYASPSTARIEYSTNGGQTFSEVVANGDVTVAVMPLNNNGTSLFFDTEMVALNLSSASLQGVRLRESPTRRSQGRATLRSVDNGATMVSSFFDVEIEISLNNGATWFPSLAPVRVELTAEAIENFGTSDNLTPLNSAYVSPVNAPSINYGGGLFTRNYIHYRLQPHRPIPFLGSSLVYTSGGVGEFQVSLDGERTYMNVQANAITEVVMTHATDIGPTKFLDTQIRRLDFFGGNLPNNLRIRVSPTKPSYGQAAIRLLNPEPPPPGLGPQPGWDVTSFFDINTEISVDSGLTWRPATASQRIVLDARAPQNFSPSDNLTPPNSAYVSPPNSPPIPYFGGILTRNYTHFRLAPHPPLPPLGTTQTWVSGGLAQFQVSLDGGGSWSNVLAQANTTVLLTPENAEPAPIPPEPFNGTNNVKTELIQLDIFGGNLPSGVRLRINPTVPSRGQATIERVGAGFNLSSFFDINTQISVDNGANWRDAKSDQRVMLDSRGPENFSADGNLTPANGAYVSEASAPAIAYSFDTSLFAEYVATRDYVHYRLAPHPGLPPPGGSLVYTSTGIADFKVSVDGGRNFSNVTAQAITMVRMTAPVDLSPDPTVRYFATEMLQLDIFGGTLPQGARIRISPGKQSGGQATVQQVPGGYRISSFFVLWTDLTLNNGTTWIPSRNNQRVMLDARAPQSFVPSTDLTPANSAYVSALNGPNILYPGNIITRNYIHGRLLPHPPLPPLGSNIVYSSGGQAVFDVSTDGGNTFSQVVAQANTTVRMRHSEDLGATMFFDNELLQLDIFGGTLPNGVRLRVSPTRPSRGQATIQASALSTKGDIGISSFFDINTEISLNNGQTWLPAQNAQRVMLDVRAPEKAYTQNLLPPRGVSYDTAIEALPLRYPIGIITHRYRHRILTNIIVPPPIGVSRIYNTLGSDIFFDVSTDGGLSFQPARATADMSLRITHSEDAGGIEYYDTELLSLDFRGGNLPNGVRFRESPTRRSLGQTTIRSPNAQPGSTGFPISSFIDIWSEVSLDNGQSWSPADSFARVRAIPLMLSVVRSGANVVVSWNSEDGILQSASTLAGGGNWADVVNQSNPFLSGVNVAPKYFRVRYR